MTYVNGPEEFIRLTFDFFENYEKRSFLFWSYTQHSATITRKTSLFLQSIFERICNYILIINAIYQIIIAFFLLFFFAFFPVKEKVQKESGIRSRGQARGSDSITKAISKRKKFNNYLIWAAAAALLVLLLVVLGYISFLSGWLGLWGLISYVHVSIHPKLS